MGDPTHERVLRLTGIALMCGAVACFALLDTTAKYLNLYMSTLEVAWARYTGAFLFPFILSNPWTRPGLLRTTRPLLQIVRSLLLLGSTLFNFAALRYLQLDQAIAVVFSTPFFVAALSGPLLGEWVRWRRWSAIAVGFVGVLVVTRPEPGTFQAAALLSVSAALCYALYPSRRACLLAPMPTTRSCSIPTASARRCCCRSCRSSEPRRPIRSSSRSWWYPARSAASATTS